MRCDNGPIVRVDRSIIKTCIRLRAPTCTDATVTNIKGVRISKAEHACTPPTQDHELVWNGCCYEAARRCECRRPVVLWYSKHDVDHEGRVCFYWDELLYQQPPGRYVAIVIDCFNNEISRFQIELGVQAPIIDQVNNETATPCGENDGC